MCVFNYLCTVSTNRIGKYFFFTSDFAGLHYWNVFSNILNIHNSLLVWTVSGNCPRCRLFLHPGGRQSKGFRVGKKKSLKMFLAKCSFTNIIFFQSILSAEYEIHWYKPLEIIYWNSNLNSLYSLPLYK